MLVELIAILALAVPAEETVTLEPASEEDRLDRVAYFDSLVKSSALKPCQERFPSRAAAFAEAHDAWKRANKTRIRAGEASIHAAAPEAASEPFDVAGAQLALTQVLAELAEADRLPWCHGHFPPR